LDLLAGSHEPENTDQDIPPRADFQAAGTVLTAGTHTLSVTFTPTNTVDYKTATDSVMLKVK
jgi:hypothetical protein